MHLIMLASLVLPPSALPAQDWLDRVLEAARLPVAAAEARDAGVANNQIGDVLEVIRRRQLPAADARYVLEEETRAVREGGRRENFGAFVQSQLDAGLRGRALADAIHEEHRRRGMGRPGDRPGDPDERRRRNEARDGDRPNDRPGDADERRRRNESRENRPQNRDSVRRDREGRP